MSADENIKTEIPSVPFAEFLEGISPGSITSVSDVAKKKSYSGTLYHELVAPDLQLHCSHDSCNGMRFFRRSPSSSLPSLEVDEWKFFYLGYRCANCQSAEKTFSLAVNLDKGGTTAKAYKFGELPEYGPPTPARLIKLIGPDRDAFLKGRRCENQGLGIGAFVYYRRVVENQKNRILDEIIKVAKKLNVSSPVLLELEAAKSDTQFTKAIGNVKQSIPQSLLINGHNPLLLLHRALSAGVHELTDSECLELAASIRVVLAELSDRLSQALKDEAELNRALSHLLKD
jgi:hypothetical protein